MAATTPTHEIEPMAFINGASRFFWAAEELQKLLKPVPDPNDDPVYLLMAHSIELALKGYLRLQGVPTATLARQYGHNLQDLLKECEQRRFPFGGDRLSLRNVVCLLDESNRNQGLR